MRIWDQPDHPHYGPVRRLWIMLAQLDLLDTADQVWPGIGWDDALVRLLTAQTPEHKAHQTVLYHSLKELTR